MICCEIIISNLTFFISPMSNIDASIRPVVFFDISIVSVDLPSIILPHI